MERFFRDLKTERLNYLSFINHSSVDSAVTSYISFYNYKRLHPYVLKGTLIWNIEFSLSPYNSLISPNSFLSTCLNKNNNELQAGFCLAADTCFSTARKLKKSITSCCNNCCHNFFRVSHGNKSIK